MVNKKKGYDRTPFYGNIRSIYLQQIKSLDVSVTDFLDNAIGRQLNIQNISDEWIVTKIQAHEKSIDGLKTLLTERINKRINDENKMKPNDKLKKEYDSFCDYLVSCPDGDFNTKRVNKKYNIILEDYNHFMRLQEMNGNGGFDFEEFKKLKGN